MKKLFQLLTVAGVIILLYSALALDSNTITTNQAITQTAITAIITAPGIIYNHITEE